MVEMYEFGWFESDYSESSSKKRNKQISRKKRELDNFNTFYPSSSYSNYSSEIHYDVSEYEEYDKAELVSLRDISSMEEELDNLQKTMRSSMSKQHYYSSTPVKTKLEEMKKNFDKVKSQESFKEIVKEITNIESTFKTEKEKKVFSKKYSNKDAFVPQTEEQLDKIRNNIAMSLGF